MDRRTFLLSGAAAMAAAAVPRPRLLNAMAGAARPLPSPAQLAWQRDELAMFCHFGVNTFTDREWGEGTEDPAIFNPTRFDAGQWARTARAAGFRAMILTAKHHDGFCLWPTATTTHSVASSPWRGGRGDVVRDFVNACRAEGLRPGLYLSPWDRNNPAYGDSPRYNDLYCAQLTELLTRYGTIAEVWFDGANGEGPNGRKQVYDWPRFWALVRRLQPDAVMFSDAGPDVRWCGNERGVAGDPNWSTVDPAVVSYPGESGPQVTPELQHGDPAGSAWRPAEADVSIRPGWFYHASQDAQVRTVDSLVDLYCSSVGRNSKLLLNVPPTRAGVLHEVDVARLAAFRERREAMFGTDLAAGGRSTWQRANGARATLTIKLGAPVDVAAARLEEPIERGQAVARYTLYGSAGGDWQPLSRGTTIGYAKLDRFDAMRVRRVRLEIEDAATEPAPVSVRLFGDA
ncbi:MAG TPA: alpha-L-fucosidase [Gemmatimonadaceae bacterium]